MKLFMTLTALLFSVAASATVPPSLYLKNQYGEVSNNYVTGGTFTTKLPATMLLTGFVAGAGTVASGDTVLVGIDKLAGNILNLQNGTFTPQSEAIIAAGAVSTTKMESTVSNVTSGTYAVTLAAPSSQDGQIKIIKAVATMTHTVTLAMTNIATPGFLVAVTGLSGSTTLTFTNAGDCVILIAVGGKWQIIGGSAVAS